MNPLFNLPYREVTPEGASLPEPALSRRGLLGGLALGALGLGGLGAGGAWWLWRQGGDEEILSTGSASTDSHYPAKRNPSFASADRPLTNEAEAARYCNFYEFSAGKAVWREVGRFRPQPWTLEVAGLVAKPRTYDLDDLLDSFPLEERIYRHRCVEAWAMVVPWTGFPLRELIRKAEPLPGARYVRFASFHDPEQAPRQNDLSMPWPYTEGLTLEEATNELSLLVTGMYGHSLLKQHGAPVRLVLPWKYGFKSAKSIGRIELTERRPATFWNTLVPHEYDFWANVNPGVPHPRWSQASERMLGSGERRPTLLYNGYGEWVGKMYRT